MATVIPAIAAAVALPVAAALGRTLQRQTRATRRSDAHFPALVGNLPQTAVVTFDRDLRLDLVAGTALEISGVTAAALRGKRLDEVVPAWHLERLEGPYRAALAGERSSFEYSSANDGRDLQVNVVPLRDADGRIAGGLAVSLDVTERKRAETALNEAKERFAAAGRAANLGLWSCEVAKRSFYGDANVERLLGAPAGSLDGTLETFLAHLDGGDRMRFAEQLSTSAEERDDFFVEFHVDASDGRRRGLVARGTAVDDGVGKPLRLAGAIWDATELLAAQEATCDSEERFRTALENAPNGMALVDADGRFRRVNASLCELLGYSEAQLLERTAMDVTHPRDLALVGEVLARLLAGEADSDAAEVRQVHADGRVVWLSLRVAIVRGPGGEARHFVAQFEDITERREAQRAMELAEQRFRSAFDEVRVGMAIVDVERNGEAIIDRVNPTLCMITGRRREELEGGSLASIIYPEAAERLASSLAEIARGGVTFTYETSCLGPAGEPVPVALSASVMLAADGVRQVLLHMQDITDRKRAENWLQHLADRDPLTGLFNRRRFGEELTRELARAARYGTEGAVLAIDLDGFKYVNDSLGHAAGDDLIVKLGGLLHERLRESDVFARLGGDEFAVILPRVDEAGARTAAADLLQLIRTAGVVDGQHAPLRVSASIGVALFRGGTVRTAEQLLVEADIAMYDAKDAGRDQVAVYDPDSHRHALLTANLDWDARIRAALAGNGFVLHAQPIRPLGAHGTARHELLLRMHGDDGELISPRKFLGLAERSDLILEIDRWVVRQAIALLAERQLAGQKACFEINLSAKSITDPELPDLVAAELAATGADGSGLVFEITETAAIGNVDRAQAFARRLARMGCEFALDDFGSGFASFYYLKHLTFDYLKIDGEFVTDLPRCETNQVLVRSLADMARGMGKRTIAEFVEDEATLRLLREYGVDYAQGYHVGRPKAVDPPADEPA